MSLIYETLKSPLVNTDAEITAVEDGPNSSGSTIYIFAIDVNTSMRSPVEPPSWFDESIERIMGNNVNISPRGLENTFLSLARIRLSSALLTLLSHGNKNNDVFLIWEFGENVRKIYPTTRSYAMLSKENVSNALETTLSGEPHWARFSDYRGPIELALENYSTDSVSGESFAVVLTILGDLMPDAEDLGYSLGDSDHSRGRVYAIAEQALKDSSASSVMINFININNTDFLSFLNLGTLSAVRTFPLQDNSSEDSMLSPLEEQKEIVLYYTHTHPFGIESRSFLVTFKDSSKIYLRLVSDNHNEVSQPLSLRWELIPRSKGGRKKPWYKIEDREINVGGGRKLIAIEDFEALRFYYNGPLDPNLSKVTLEIWIPEHNVNHLLPLQFIRVLPLWSAISFTLVSFTIILISVAYLITRWRNYRESEV